MAARFGTAKCRVLGVTTSHGASTACRSQPAGRAHGSAQPALPGALVGKRGAEGDGVAEGKPLNVWACAV